jgi:hypothetical protein
MLKRAPNFILGSAISSTYLRRYASGIASPVASLRKGRVSSARLG